MKTIWLFASSVIPYIFVSLAILMIAFEMESLELVGLVCFVPVVFLNFPLIFISGTGSYFFFLSFITDTLIIYGIIKLILFIKQRIADKKEFANN